MLGGAFLGGAGGTIAGDLLYSVITGKQMDWGETRLECGGKVLVVTCSQKTDPL